MQVCDGVQYRTLKSVNVSRGAAYFPKITGRQSLLVLLLIGKCGERENTAIIPVCFRHLSSSVVLTQTSHNAVRFCTIWSGSDLCRSKRRCGLSVLKQHKTLHGWWVLMTEPERYSHCMFLMCNCFPANSTVLRSPLAVSSHEATNVTNHLSILSTYATDEFFHDMNYITNDYIMFVRYIKVA